MQRNLEKEAKDAKRSSTKLCDAASFVEVKQLAAASEYTQAQATFENAPVGARIAIRYKDGNYWGSLYVDNIELTESTVPTAIDNNAVTNKAVKRIVNRQVVIEHYGARYNVLGTELK